jgi:hypothetical protein
MLKKPQLVVFHLLRGKERANAERIERRLNLKKKRPDKRASFRTLPQTKT